MQYLKTTKSTFLWSFNLTSDGNCNTKMLRSEHVTIFGNVSAKKVTTLTDLEQQLVELEIWAKRKEVKVEASRFLFNKLVNAVLCLVLVSER